MLSNKVYDILRFIADIFLPAAGTLYFALSGIWGFPYGEQIVGTIMALTAFFDAILAVSKAQYNKGNDDGNG